METLAERVIVKVLQLAGLDYWKALYLVDRGIYKEIKKNKKFHNCHTGKRCFILGNAPSLLDVDFSCLKNEIVFACNHIAFVEGYEKLNVNYYFAMDEAFFCMDNKVRTNNCEIAKTFSKIGENKGIEFFVPYNAMEFVKTNLDKNLRINYIYRVVCPKMKKSNVRLDKKCYPFQLTVQMMIGAAIYMGFDKIYLLGLEESAIIDLLNNRAEHSMRHAYNNELERKTLLGAIPPLSMVELLRNYEKVFSEYEKLAQYCKDNKIQLFNSTPYSLIDSIDHKNLDMILKKES